MRKLFSKSKWECCLGKDWSCQEEESKEEEDVTEEKEEEDKTMDEKDKSQKFSI